MAGSEVRPYYVPIGNEEHVFKAAYRRALSIVLKGPTGCGKTRFVEAMAYDLKRPLITVACHDDLTTADLVGRFLLRGGERVAEGPVKEVLTQERLETLYGAPVHKVADASGIAFLPG